MLQTAGTFFVEQGIARVVGQLAKLRRRLRARLLVQGLARWLWLIIAVSTIDFVLDWVFRLDQPQRTVLLMAVVAMLSYAAYRWIIVPLAAPLSDDALALAIEEHEPRFDQRLISGLQLARVGDPANRGMSPALVKRAVVEALQLAEDLPLDDVLDRRRFARSAVLLAAACAILVAIGVGSALPGPLRIWLHRNLLVSSISWPTKTVLVVGRIGADGVLVFPRGQNWTQMVTVSEESRVVPSAVSLDIRHSGPPTTIAMKRVGSGRFETSFPGVSQPFELRARGGDAVTPWIPVTLVDPPELVSVRLIVTPPGYTLGKPEELPAGQSPYSVLPGSKLHLEAAVNKKLARAELVVAGRPLTDAEAKASSISSAVSLVSTHGALVADIEADMLLAGDYRFELRDEFGFTSSHPWGFTIKQLLDLPPQVHVELVGIGGVVTPTARIPLHGTARDDYGLATLNARLRGGGAADATPIDTHVELPAARQRLIELDGQLGHVPKELSFDEAIDLAPLKLSAGSSMQLVVAALDNNDVLGPSTGHSEEITLRVVTDRELLADLLRREKLARQELAALTKEQFELVTQTRALAASLGSEATLSADKTSELAALARRQKVAGEQLASTAERLMHMAQEIVNNRLEEAGGRMHARLSTQIAQPLYAVASDQMPSAANSLTSARLNLEPAAQRRLLSQAASQQAAAGEQMQAILLQMVQAEGFQEAVQLLYEIERAQAEVHEQTRRALEERIRRILEGSGKRP